MSGGEAGMKGWKGQLISERSSDSDTPVPFSFGML